MKALLILLLTVVAVKASPDELRLLNDLVVNSPRADVVKMLRPVEEDGNAVVVDFGIILIGVNDISESSTSVDGWIKVSWVDSYLTWEPSDYGDIEEVHLKAEHIWTPDIEQFAGDGDIDWESVLMIAYPNGTVLTVVPVQFDMDCEGEEAKAEGEYECTAKFGSWTYDESKVDMRNLFFDVSWLSDKRLEDVEGTALRESVQYEPWPLQYVDGLFTLKFKYEEERSNHLSFQVV